MASQLLRQKAVKKAIQNFEDIEGLAADFALLHDLAERMPTNRNRKAKRQAKRSLTDALRNIGVNFTA